MSGIVKTVVKVGAIFAISFGLGYAEYRIKGGKPIRKLYKEVCADKQRIEELTAKAAKMTPIEAEGKVE